MIADELARIKRAELAAALDAGEGILATELENTVLGAPVRIQIAVGC